VDCGSNFNETDVSLYQKNIEAEFIHWYMPSLCEKIGVNRHDHEHPILGVETNKMSSIEYGIGTQYVWQEGMRKTVLGL